MVTQEFLSDLWSVNGLTYTNVGVFQSHSPTATPSASTTLTPQASNPDKSKGRYKSPLQTIMVLPPMIPPQYRERNEMNPLQQKEQNLMMERIAVPDPRMNITGNNVPTNQRLENMDIQTAPFNYNAIFGIVGILASVVAIVWLARRK
jgi:hypothetical protein